MDDAVASALQRKILGLDNAADRDLLEGVQVKPELSNEAKEAQEIREDTKGFEDMSRSNLEHENENFPVEDHPTDLWPALVDAIREGIATSTSDASTIGSMVAADDSSNEAGLIGEFLKNLKAVAASLDRERDLLSSIKSSRRLPAFARKDIVIVKRRELDELRKSGLTAVDRLSAAMDDGAIDLLRVRNAREVCCNAVDSLSVAWRSGKAVTNLRAGKSSSKGKPFCGDPLAKQPGSMKSRHNGAHKETLTEEEVEMIGDADTALDNSLHLVAVAQNVLTTELRRRRTNVACGAAAHIRGDHSKEALSPESQHRQAFVPTDVVPPAHLSGPRAGRTKEGIARFDNYARGSVPKVGGTLAMAQRGREAARQRKASQHGSVHISRHVEHCPTFHDVLGLRVGASKAALHESDRRNEQPQEKKNKQLEEPEPDEATKLHNIDIAGVQERAASVLLAQADQKPSPRELSEEHLKENVDMRTELRKANNARQPHGGHVNYMEERNKVLIERVHGLSPKGKPRMLPAQRRLLEKQQQGAGKSDQRTHLIIPERLDTQTVDRGRGYINTGPLSSAIDMSAPSLEKW